MKKSGLSPWLLAAIHALRARGAAMVAAARRDWRRLAWHGGRVGLYTSSAVGLVAVVGTLALWARPTWRADLASRVGPLLEAATGTANAAGQSANGAADAKLSPSDSAMMAQAAQHVPSAAVLAAYIPNQRVAADARANKVLDTREQIAVADYLARRYRVAGDVTGNLVRAAYSTGKEVGLDPLLLLAVMAIESGFNPYAESTVGAQGLMQVMSKVHQDKLEYFGGPEAALHPLANIKVGALILKECIARGGSLAGGLRLYVGSTSAGDGGYGAKVLAERDRLRGVAMGRKISPYAPQAPVIVSSAKPVTKPVSAGKSSDDAAESTSAPAASTSTGKAAAAGKSMEADDSTAA
ncbi:Membrane-bound lytic murein transglycosylase C [Pandoraea pnomenusa]|jgi:soluble lytic murein transglycosylase-like protein|uniref:Murein transglycosylase C n=2 Tax=Burkholderiaceae TaxID=119060 RepID=A0A378YUX3_9BURK|nr:MULTISPECIES: lytic transglycosylase domain-containing protein [Pandoraea]SUA80914.1 murein transglycosylase C [Pandoraea pnomenusa]VVE66628.1 Membrane-bound lytic murein transglycosylase C [Pandoraea pnomenusa]